mgnify:CR=1 FL=1
MAAKLPRSTGLLDWDSVDILRKDLLLAWEKGRKVFLCGNGGSAANANHLANDLLCGISPEKEKGLHVHSLASNVSVSTCLANDTGYENIFSKQLPSLAKREDLLIALSGSGNSSNILNAITKAKEIGLKTHSIVGFDGGKCREISDNCIHLPLHDMQVSEDFQMIIGHILMKYLKSVKN